MWNQFIPGAGKKKFHSGVTGETVALCPDIVNS